MMKVHVLGVMACAVVAVVSSGGGGPSAHAGQYVVIDLGVGVEPTAVSNAGHVAGGYDVGGSLRAFLWVEGVLTDLGLPPGPGFETAFAYDINENDEVVGATDGSAGQCAFLYTGATPVSLGPGAALALNDALEVVGYVTEASVDKPAVWRNGQLTKLSENPGEALAINSAGQILVAGAANRVITGGQSSMLPTIIPVFDVPTIDGTTTYVGLDDQGWAVGTGIAFADDPLDPGRPLGWPFAWRVNTGCPIELPGGCLYGIAHAVSAGGTVLLYPCENETTREKIGIWKDGLSAEVTGNLVPPEWKIAPHPLARQGINDAGQFVAMGRFGEETALHGLLIVPADGPALEGDVDRDGDVDVFDVTKVINSFGLVTGSVGSDWQADLDLDGIVGIFDVISVVVNFGAGS